MVPNGISVATSALCCGHYSSAPQMDYSSLYVKFDTPSPSFAQTTLRLTDMVERACRSMSGADGRHLNYKFTTMKQMEERGRAASSALHAKCLATLNLRRQALRIGRKLEGFKKVMMFLGENDVPGVRRVLGQALKDGKSPFAVMNTLRAAFEGRYHARGHNQDDLDLAIPVMRVGGPALLYALSKSLSLPSITSVYVEMRKSHVSGVRG